MEPTSSSDLHPNPNDTRPGRGEVVVLRDGIKVSRLVLAPGRSLPPHTASFDMIVIVVRGHGTFTVEEEVRHVQPGDILDFVPDEHHAVEAHEELELVFVECPRIVPLPNQPPPLPR
jgi:quercetin dioxygenase-like cupin family protein